MIEELAIGLKNYKPKTDLYNAIETLILKISIKTFLYLRFSRAAFSISQFFSDFF